MSKISKLAFPFLFSFIYSNCFILFSINLIFSWNIFFISVTSNLFSFFKKECLAEKCMVGNYEYEFSFIVLTDAD